jgi:stage II sporulation protein D
MKWALMLVLSVSSFGFSQTWLPVKVLSKYHPQTVTIETRTREFHFDAAQQDDFEFEAPLDDAITVTVNNSTTRYYRGRIRLHWQGDEIEIINTTPLEYYVAGVVVGEIGADAHPELIKAQAIIARTYALKINQNDTLSDLAYHQVYKGFDHYAQKVYETTSRSATRILKQKGQVADLLFHAECGSFRYSPGEFWESDQVFEAQALSNDIPKGVLWQITLTDEQLQQVFPGFESVTKLATRPVQFEVVQQNETTVHYAENFRLSVNRVHGWNTIPSNEFTLSRAVNSWQLMGRGRGHLVGLCQQQAQHLASRGWLAENLLAYFYPNLSFGIIAVP